MTDKERILMNIIRELDFTMMLAPNPKGFREQDFIRGHTDISTYVHFARYRKAQPGDLVLCTTMNINDWKIGWYVKRFRESEALIREIGTDRVCRVCNEQFAPIVGMRDDQLLEGDNYIFYTKATKAFLKGSKYCYRFGGVDFNKDNPRNATIWVREVFGGLNPDNPSKPFPVHIHWNKKTSIKKILETMVEQGYGTKKFEKEQNDEC